MKLVDTKNNFFVFEMQSSNNFLSFLLFFNDFLFRQLKNKQTDVWIKTKTLKTKWTKNE